ncbi:MAG: ABC transporter permease [Oscillospiraceae bacterium]|nr:ABC transporter permease [Oscillospiraceae bacterium]
MKDFYRYRFLLTNLITRDIKVKYRRSALGILWSVLNPLLMMLVMSAVFTYMFNDRMGSGIPNFPVYLLTGQLVFNSFNDATTMAMNSVMSAAPLMKKVYIPKYIFPLAKVSFGFVNTLFSMIALIFVMLITGQPFHFINLLGILPLVLLYLFNLGVGLFLSSAVVFFRDIMHFWTVFITALTYATPIFYPVEMLPAWMQSFEAFNPMYWYVTMFRQVVLYAKLPTLNQMIACTLCAVFALVVGGFVFKKTQDSFILYI